ncbi:MAG TPA: hypothetical protein VFQ11_07570 [Nocardioidaceae bacterium]|nr:hypothetical protein [Nocardioidaceae bacterium]
MAISGRLLSGGEHVVVSLRTRGKALLVPAAQRPAGQPRRPWGAQGR